MQIAEKLYSHPPLISILFSIGLMYGIITLGEKVLSSFFPFLFLKRNYAQSKSLAGCLSLCLISTCLYPIALFIPHANYLFFIISQFVFLFGIFYAICDLKKYFLDHKCIIKLEAISSTYRDLLKADNKLKIKLVILITIYFLLSLSAPSDADSIDYHLGVPLQFIRDGIWPFTPEWFHSRLAGAGEILISLGVSIGADQFGQLLQFFGLFVISTCIIGDKFNNRQAMLLLIFLISPPLIWLVSSSKPQLLPMAFSALAFSIAISDKTILKNQFCIAVILIMTAALMKFNYVLSGLIVLSILIYRSYCNKNLLFLISIGLIIFFITCTPILTWKILNYGGPIHKTLFGLFGGDWPGYQDFYFSLKSYKDSSVLFPISLLFNPFPSEWTSSLAVVIIAGILLFGRLLQEQSGSALIKIVCLAIALLIGITSLFGQHTARFYLEPTVWILIASTYISNLDLILKDRIFNAAINIQMLIVIISGLFGLYALMPGIFTTHYRDNVLKKTANGYSEMSYANMRLPKGTILLTNVRSKALSNHRTISLDWEQYVNFEKDNYIKYLQIIKSQNVSYILFRGSLIDSPWINCLTDASKIENSRGKVATRNIFHETNSYEFYLGTINVDKLPDCFFSHSRAASQNFLH